MSLFYNLCSSSSGNATFVGDREGGLLFDAGVGIRNFSKWLLAQGTDTRFGTGHLSDA